MRQLRGADAAVLLRAARRSGAQPELGGDRLSRAGLGLRRRPEEAPKTIDVEQVEGETAELEADVCVVGSGAGGAVIAAELQRARA